MQRDPSASRHLRPPRPSFLLLLQLLTVGAVSLAVASPRVTAPPRQHLFVLLDASASMLAVEGGVSRFDEAVRQARGLLAALGPQDHATVLRVGPRPAVLVRDAEPLTAQSALGGLAAGAGSAAMREALFVASDLARRDQDSASRAIVMTDGAFAEPGDLSGIGLPVRFETIGRGDDNRAVTGLRVERHPRPAAGFAALARVVNYADRPARVAVRLLSDGVPQESRDLDVAARSRTELSFAVPEGARRVAVSLIGQDSLAADDAVEISVEAGHARQVLLVSRLPELLERALRAIPDLRVQTVSPEAYTGAGAELVVLDGILPDRLPSGQLLIVNPPSGRPSLPVLGELRSAEVVDFDARHPLLQSVDLSAVRLAKASAIDPPLWARVVAETVGGPLIVEGQESGRKVVVFGFDPSAAGVDRMIAFPLLISNAVAFLAGGELTPSLPVGRSATLPVTPGVREVQLGLPDGSARTLPVVGASVRLDGLEQPGRYTVRERGETAGDARTFSINVADEAESDLAPRPRPAVEAATSRPDRPSLTPLEIWPALLGLGLVLLGAEWWHFGARG